LGGAAIHASAKIEGTIIMGKEPVVEPTDTKCEACPCQHLAEHITALLGIRSPEAKQHLRNARIEMLKAVRSVIDERIDHFSRIKAKGAKIAVD
jgi:hypothetical protein